MQFSDSDELNFILSLDIQVYLFSNKGFEHEITLEPWLLEIYEH